MHRHRHTITDVCRKCVQVRCSSTAAKMKPISESMDAPYQPPLKPTNWARTAPPVRSATPLPSRSWERPAPVPSGSGVQAKPSAVPNIPRTTPWRAPSAASAGLSDLFPPSPASSAALTPGASKGKKPSLPPSVLAPNPDKWRVAKETAPIQRTLPPHQSQSQPPPLSRAPHLSQPPDVGSWTARIDPSPAPQYAPQPSAQAAPEVNAPSSSTAVDPARGLAPHQIIPAAPRKEEPELLPANIANLDNARAPPKYIPTRPRTRSDGNGLQQRTTEPDSDSFDFSADTDLISEGQGRRRKDAKHRHLDEYRGTRLRHLHEPQYQNDTSYKRSQTPQAPVIKKRRAYKSLAEKRIIPDVYIPSVVSVGALAQLLGVRLAPLQRAMRRAGMEEEMAYDHVLTADYAALLAEEFGQNPIIDDELAFNLYARAPHPDPASLPTRPPVVTIMGHVDHGKTTLLDTLRSTAVAKGEAGGITQHIGAFSVPVPGTTDGSITFLDTPGHAAFSAMRARGASVTDIIVLVVAADDGIMPQTREVIELIKKDRGKVSVVVAINKVDKPAANVDACKRGLLAEGIELEDFGGDIPSVEVSGLTGHNLPTLVETLSAMAEMQDIRAEKDGDVNGYVLESRVVKGLGNVATVLVLRGSLKAGDHLVAGLSQAKVRNMTDSAGKPVKIATPGMAITVSGWKTVPSAGDEVLQGKESDIKKALHNRTRRVELEASLKDVDAINKARKEERERREAEDEEEEMAIAARWAEEHKGPQMVKILVKADVSGSAEAVAGAIHGIGNDLAKSQVISSAVGDVTESDIMTAKAAGAGIAAFSVKVSKSMEILANQNSVKIFSSTIIYRLVENVTDRVIEFLPKIINTRVTGEATVLQIFDIALKGGAIKKVAGSRVTNGIMEKGKPAKVLRNGEVIHTGSMDTMRIVKKDVTEIRKGTECGLSLENYADLQAGDVIQMVEYTELPGEI